METLLVSLSPTELRRLAVTERVVAGDLNQLQAAALLGLSYRQVKRIIRAFRTRGAEGLISSRRGRQSNRAVKSATIDLALAIVAKHYADFGPTLASEKLAERHGIHIDHETLRRAMMRHGCWSPKPRKTRERHLPRPRRPCFGELVQIDGSHHRWFEDRGGKCTLLVAIDDATSALLALYFSPQETTVGYFALIADYLKTCGRPTGFYSDRYSVFRPANESPSAEKTQFARALDELDIELICANSPQAKGRVERVNATLQDRFVKELRLQNISSIEAANAFAPTFIAAHNKRFATLPLSDFDAHRPLEAFHDLERILSVQHVRTISEKGIVSYDGRLLAIDDCDFRRLSSRKISVRTLASGRLVLEQGPSRLAYCELPPQTPVAPIARAPIDRRIPNPKKAHAPSADHPWKRPFVPTALLEKGHL